MASCTQRLTLPLGRGDTATLSSRTKPRLSSSHRSVPALSPHAALSDAPPPHRGPPRLPPPGGLRSSNQEYLYGHTACTTTRRSQTLSGPHRVERRTRTAATSWKLSECPGQLCAVLPESASNSRMTNSSIRACTHTATRRRTRVSILLTPPN